MGNEKKQTAVDWLYMMMHSIGMANDENNKKILLKAKQMEREQIEEDFSQGMNNSLDYFIPNSCKSESQQYYEQTYGTTN